MDLSRLQAIVSGAVWLAIVVTGGALLRRLRSRWQTWRYQRDNHSFPPPKFPQLERILGIDMMLDNIRCWQKNTLLTRHRWRYETAGPTYGCTIAGQDTIFTTEPENIKTVFSDGFSDFDAGWLRRRAFAPAIGDVLITADGPKWHRQRAMMRPAFNRKQITDYDFFERDLDALIARIPKDGSTLDMAPLFYVHALNLASRLLFDEPLASLTPEFDSFPEKFLRAFHGVNRGNELRLRMGRLLPLQPRDREYEAALKVVHEYGDHFVRRALNHQVSRQLEATSAKGGVEGRYVFLRELAKATQDPTELRNHLLGMLLVGSETTASLLTSCLSLLSSRQGLWTKMRAEVLGIGDCDPTYERVKNLTTLNSVINEGRQLYSSEFQQLTALVLRLYPVLPMFGRTANKDTFLPIGGGPDRKARVFVPKNTIVSINTYCLHRRKDIFGPDADDFKPERWASLNDLGYWAYLPFGGGPRVCIGRKFYFHPLTTSYLLRSCARTICSDGGILHSRTAITKL